MTNTGVRSWTRRCRSLRAGRYGGEVRREEDERVATEETVARVEARPVIPRVVRAVRSDVPRAGDGTSREDKTLPSPGRGNHWSGQHGRRSDVRRPLIVCATFRVRAQRESWSVQALGPTGRARGDHSSRCSMPCLETFASVISSGIQSGLSDGASSSQDQPS